MHPALTSQLKSGLITLISNIALFRDPDHLFLHLIELFALVASTHTAVAGLHHQLSFSLLTATPEHFIHYEYARHLFLGRTGRPSALSRRYVARSLFLPFPSSSPLPIPPGPLSLLPRPNPRRRKRALTRSQSPSAPRCSRKTRCPSAGARWPPSRHATRASPRAGRN